MKKQIFLLSTAALLAASFVSCVDNDEPKGLRQLRQAKAEQWLANAELTRAKTAMAVAADSLQNELTKLTNYAQSLANKSTELALLKTEALNNIEVEGKTCSLNLVKAQYDYQIAEESFKLAKFDETKKEQLAKEKAKVVAAELALKQAQENYDNWVAETAVRKAQLEQDIKEAEAQLKNEEAALKETLFGIQQRLDQLAYDQAAYAAQLEQDTYTLNLNNLLTMASLRKNAWDNVLSAYSTLRDKEGYMISAQKTLAQKQQELLVAINTYEKDSAAYLKDRKDDVTNKQYAYDMAERNVLLAENALAEFNEVSKGDYETWNKAYNDLATEIKTLEQQIKYKEIAILEADNAVDQAQVNLDNKKDEVEKPLSDFNKKKNFYTFEVDEAIEEDFNLPGGAYKFTYKNGIIANEDGIKNSDLGAQLEALLEYIGDDENPAMYKDEAGIKQLNDDIKGFNDEIKGFNDEIDGFNKDIVDINKQYTEDSSAYIAQINNKQAEIVTKEQQLAEFKNQNEIVATFKSDSTAFVAASAAYKAKALEYKWSDNTGKSTYYDAVKTIVEEFNDLWNDVDGDAEKDVLTDTDLQTKRKSVQTQIKNYWNLRESFDGQKIPDAVKDDVVDSDLADDTKKNAFDALVNGSLTALIGGNGRVDGGEKDGAWGKFIVIADKLLGNHDQYVVYTKEQMEGFHANNELGTKGTMGARYAYKYAIADLEKEIADLNKDIDDIKDQILADRETADENIENKKQDIKDKEQEIADKEEEIADTEEEIANNAKWADLYNTINDVKEAFDAELKALTIAQQEAYNTQLTPLEEALAKAEAKQKQLTDEKKEMNLTKGYKKDIQDLYFALIGTVEGTTGNDPDAELKAEIIIKFAIIELQHKVDYAKQDAEDLKLELDNAKKDLADFLAGEYKTTQNNYIATVLEKDKAVKYAQADYDKTVKDYEVAKAYYEEVLAAVEGEEE